MRAVHDAMKPKRPSPFDIRDEIIHEYAFRRLRIGVAMAMPEKLRGRLAGADFVRQDQGIEMAQHVGELHCETLGMNCVRIASEQDAMMPRELRDQVAHFGIGPEDIADGLGQEFDGDKVKAYPPGSVNSPVFHFEKWSPYSS